MRARSAWFALALLGAAGRMTAQSGDPRPAIAVLNLRFDGEHATVLEPGDTAVAYAATSKLLATLRESAAVTVVDSAQVAAAVTALEADGNPCDNACTIRVGRELGARWVAKGTVTKTSNLVWILSAQLFEVATGKLVLADGYEIKGDASRIAPAGAHVFAQRIEKTIIAVP